MALSGLLEVIGSLEIELGKSGGEEVQEYTFMLLISLKKLLKFYGLAFIDPA